MRRCGRGRLEASHRAASRFSRPGCAPAGADGRADGCSAPARWADAL